MEKFVSYISLIASVYLLGITTAHVSLTFPPARKLDLDFLDSVRTKKPCGMPKGKFRTVLRAGSTVNITWHLAYPHIGGFRLELLDKNENFAMKLSDASSNATHVTGDPTAQWHIVKIPDIPCDDCTIRLLREAREWKDYAFWSCADTSIVKSDDYKEDCLGRGNVGSNSLCTCEKGYWGPRCQYKDECDNDSDCGNGKCIDIGGTTLPRKQCFCGFGFHGDGCKLQNKDTLPTPENLQLSSHKKTVLSNRMTLYHRILPESEQDDKEIEMIIVLNGTSYGAVGWRPKSLDKSCKSLPAIDELDVDNMLSRKARAARGRPQKSNPTLLEPLHTPEKIMADPGSSMNSKRSTKAKTTPKPKPEPQVSVAEPEPVPEPETEPKPETGGNSCKGESSPEAEAEPKGQKHTLPKSEPSTEPESSASEPKPETQRTTEPKSEPEGTSEPKSEPEATSQPKSEPEGTGEPKSEPEGTSEPKSEPEGTSEPKSEPEATSEPKSEPEGASEPKSEPEGTSEPKSEPEGTSEPKSEPEGTSEPKSEPEGTSEPKSEPEGTSEPKSEPEGTSEPKSLVRTTRSSPQSKQEHEAMPTLGNPAVEPDQTLISDTEPETVADESVAKLVFAEPEQYNNLQMLDDISPFKLENKKTIYTPKHDFHSMDCTDIIIGTARGMYSRVRDFYTRDRSSPRLDTIYGGTEDLTSATAWEKDGITTIIFRRKVKSSDPTDHTISGEMHVIWARGQEHGEYVHIPESGLEKEKPSMPDFYTQDELKYHGRTNQRGVKFITFTS